MTLWRAAKGSVCIEFRFIAHVDKVVLEETQQFVVSGTPTLKKRRCSRSDGKEKDAWKRAEDVEMKF